MRLVGLLAPVGILFTLVGCENDPALFEGEVYDPSVASLTPISLVKLEICSDGVDNDGDKLIDRYDPDCTKSVSTIGYSGTVVEGGDIHPGDRVSLRLDGKTVTVEHRTTALVVKSSTGTVIATIYTDYEASGVGIGKRTSSAYNDLLVVTSGNGAGYAPGRVGGTYDLDESAIPRTTSSGSTPTPPSGGTICTTGC